MITINGKNYEQKQVRIDPKMNMYILMAMAFGGHAFKSKGECYVDIAEEFGLIQLKKSNLSRSKRDWVVSQFNEMFVEVI